MNDLTSNMVSHLFITAFMVIFSSIGLSDFKWSQQPDYLDTIKFDDDKNHTLSENGRVAMHELLKTKQFTSARIGYIAHHSKAFKNFATLLNEKNAEPAFKNLIKNGTAEAKAYGLVALKGLNPALYNEIYPNIVNSNYKVSFQGGCSITEKLSLSELNFNRIAIWLTNEAHEHNSKIN